MRRTRSLAGLGLLILVAGCTLAASSGGRPPGRARGWRWGAPNYRLELIAGTGISFVADVDEDIFVCGGLWYRFANGVWFSCGSYGGAWERIPAPPAVFVKIPPGHAKHRVVKAHGAPHGKPKDKGKGKGHGKGKWK